ncbi:MAG: hypothetical protein HY554_17490 [Elusimicrobia bacterium]|nr:hypothetical protein [Elusimicrobiota bacterium]
MSPEGPSAKAASFLSSLKGGGRGGLGGGAAPSPAGDEAIRPLQRKIEELERKLAELAKAAAPPDDGEPPRAPSELMMYVHTRMELLERKLQEAQAEALRSNLLLHERERAQREAQKEVEDLFRTIQEQQRAARFDSALRDEVSAAQRRIQDLEVRLEEARLRSVPVDQVVRALKDAQAAETLAHEIEDRLRRAAPAPAPAEPPAAPGAAPPAPAPEPPAPPPSPPGFRDSGTALVLMAKIADLERQLEETRGERDQERSRRAQWENEVVGAIAEADDRWKRSGGIQVTIEAALETMASALKERKAAEAELNDALTQAQAEPPGSVMDPVLRVRITAAQERIARLQETLQGQLAMVQGWIQQNR